MSPEAEYRVTLVVILVLTMGTVLPFRVRAQTSEKFDRREEGIVLAIVLRLGGLALWIFTLAYLINPQWTAWAALPLPGWIRWAGAGFGAACIGLMVWTLRSLGKNLTDTVAIRKDATLVTVGPYRYVRHPFYVAAGLMMLSMTLLTASAALGLASVLVLGLLAARMPKEEQELLARFGEPYRKYRETTGAFFPRIMR